MLYSVLSACEFLDKKVFFFVEQATKKMKNPRKRRYLLGLVFNVNNVFKVTKQSTF